MKHLIVIMGVSGAGKSTLAKALSEELDCPFLEGDDFHPSANIEKMSGGTPLTNEDRRAWIKAMSRAVSAMDSNVVVLSCSALNEYVRDQLSTGVNREIHWVYLKVSRAELIRRLKTRPNHFMKASMLDSQIEAMSPPSNAIIIDGDQAFKDCLSKALTQLNPLF